ncbi:putative deoxyribonuclease TATDN2 [Liolophura sinensis]|uniref:putative deoxyribonuclease TATDN2 n=1 Tax=Liolophura sinensis TaxID=3198878 RepID=UPI0031595FF8
MLNGSLVCYSDSESSEGQDGELVRKKLTDGAMNPKRQQASLDNSEKHVSKLSPQRPLLANIVYSPSDGDEVFVNDPVSGRCFTETKTPRPGLVSRCKIAVTPLCIDVSSIPLPGESPVEDKSKFGSGSKKSKHSSKALYLPPALRTNSQSPGIGCGDKKDTYKEVDGDTPKRINSSKTGETGSKRKGTPLFEDLIDREEVVNTKMVKTEEHFLVDSTSNHGESRRFSEPKKVTLRPFWLACAPPSKPFTTSLCISEVHGNLRSEFMSTSSQHFSLPFGANSLNSSLDSYAVEPNSHNSLPDLSRSCAKPSAKTRSPRLCSLSDYGRSSVDSSPYPTQSPVNVNLRISETESGSRDAVQRRHSHESIGRSLSRSRLNSLPPRLRRRVVEISHTSTCRYQTSSESLSRSPWKGWVSNFQKKYFGFSDEYIDSHCHLDFLYRREGYTGSFQKYKVLHKDTFPGNFAGCVAVFCEPQSFKPKGGLWKSITLEPDVWVAMGCHPKCVEDYTSWTEEALTACLKFPKVIAAGEFGLDYSGRFRETADRQKDVFVRQLKIASAQDKPLVIHCRRAEDDTFLIMKQYASKHVSIHRHCFSLDFEEARRWFDTFPNLYVGLTPLVTYSSAVETHDLARKVPLDRLLLETDSPYFVPRDVPRADMSFSHPGMAITVAHEVASFQGIPVSKVLQATRKNTKDMYGI